MVNSGRDRGRSGFQLRKGPKGRGKSGKGRSKGEVLSTAFRKDQEYGKGKGSGKGRNSGNNQAGDKGKGKRRTQSGKGALEDARPNRRGGGSLPDGHTIVLIQYQQRTTSRTYLEFDTVAQAMDGLCQQYEQALKLQAGKNETQAKYSLEELLEFIEGLDDIACLVHLQKGGDYRPHDRRASAGRGTARCSGSCRPGTATRLGGTPLRSGARWRRGGSRAS